MPIILLILAFILVFLGIRKIYYLSSDPKAEKDFFPHIHHKRKPLDEAPAKLPFSQLGGTINDVSGVNRTSVYGILQIKTEYELRNALHFARQHKLTVSIYTGPSFLGPPYYLNFDVNEQEMRKIKEAHSELIDLAQSLGGSFYLPYQLSATRVQIEKSYPEFGKFLELKKKYDADLLFTSKFYKKYGAV